MLIYQDLYSSIRSITDEGYEGFQGWPSNLSEASERWSLAIGNYASKVIPISSTFEAARQSLKMQLMNVDSLGQQAIVLGLTQYASILGGGMSPTFTATPPPVPIVLIPTFQRGFAGASADEIATELSQLIDTWFRTGTAINNSSSVTVNWN